ncbi:hypothetical protein LTR78_000594 [Recurvomyces mirabilis]|uniref:F-box domain-containing protein n=1 Tax=Recurvomyces mirabilis TaxID=574656 RepID=A0AAE0WXE7_9PEZI|nr:hypothetical protein LTR78_000594 [Recurvomyces mirabilis]KAK5162248.1 hypothetical protein LTS14_000595 [Recurvomyces mirabilis]
MSEIEAYVAEHIRFDKDKPFHRVLADIFNSRGIWPQPVDRDPELDAVGTIWTYNQPTDVAPFAGEERWTTGFGHAYRLARCILELHLQHHAPDFVDSRIDIMDRTASIHEMARNDYGLREGYFAKVYNEITTKASRRKAIPGSPLPAPLHYRCMPHRPRPRPFPYTEPMRRFRDVPVWPLSVLIQTGSLRGLDEWLMRASFSVSITIIMAPHQCSKVTKTRFESLPPELVTNILAHLPTKEVLRARNISRHFRNLLHNWDNEKAIALTITRRSHTRIRKFIDSTLLFPKSRPFHLAFATFLVHRGIHQNHPDRFVDITAFVHLWLYVHHGPISPDLGPEEKSFRTSGLSVSLIIFAMAIIDVWSLQHHPEFPTDQPKAVQSRAAFVDAALRRSSQSRVISRIYGWDEGYLGKVWDELTAPIPPFLESAEAAKSSVQGGDRHVRGSNSSVAREAEEIWNVSVATIPPIDPCQTTPTAIQNTASSPFGH